MNIGIIGDLCLDKYVYVTPLKLSQEAPILVHKTLSEEYRLGMAGNVAANLSSFDVKPYLCTLIGEKYQDVVYSLCDKFNINTLGSLAQQTLSIKTRFVSDGQQIVRIDEEYKLDVKETFYDYAQKILNKCEAVIISDYSKGILADVKYIIGKCYARKIPVYVDPKGKHWQRYGGATLIKPNQDEFEAVYGPFTPEKAIKAKKELNIEMMLVTQGKHGMTLIDKDNRIYHSESKAKEVIDVTGCGDVVIAAFVYFHQLGLPIQTCLDLCNEMAGIAAGKQGTTTITKEDVQGTDLEKYVK